MHPGNLNCSNCMTKYIQSCEEWEQLVRFVGLEFIYEVFEECSFPIYFTSWCHPRFYCLLRTMRSKATLVEQEHSHGDPPAHGSSLVLQWNQCLPQFTIHQIHAEFTKAMKCTSVPHCLKHTQNTLENQPGKESNSLTNLRHKVGEVF